MSAPSTVERWVKRWWSALAGAVLPVVCIDVVVAGREVDDNQTDSRGFWCHSGVVFSASGCRGGGVDMFFKDGCDSGCPSSGWSVGSAGCPSRASFPLVLGLRGGVSDLEQCGHNIFAPPPEIQPRPLSARALALRESITIGEPTSHNGTEGHANGESSEPSVIKTSKKIPNQKFSELSGNDIFKGDGVGSASAEKPLSSAKLREMSGSNIFADGKAESRDYFGGVRKPPGGESSIALV
ncbi:Unknown protein [Striga hermonthica]|uniref:DUF4057 domain-containing protein n=1 Tax=Striga hermonthica TaxID=68872 RepID=A0A9N7NQD7_STRHE|nr:Unknown protein [Striga hermonthica]